jgi:phosphate transport system ATP-binding protein
MTLEDTHMETTLVAELPAQAVVTTALPQVSAAARLTVEDLSAWYGRKLALESVDLAIEDRKITALIGPSGCGKSTFLRTLNRLNDTVSGFRATGSVRVGDTEMLDLSLDVV